jgi:hypothetical protein
MRRAASSSPAAPRAWGSDGHARPPRGRLRWRCSTPGSSGFRSIASPSRDRPASGRATRCCTGYRGAARATARQPHRRRVRRSAPAARQHAGARWRARSRLEAVAPIVNAEPGVNHNYEREHAFNLWFVDHRRPGCRACAASGAALEQATACSPHCACACAAPTASTSASTCAVGAARARACAKRTGGAPPVPRGLAAGRAGSKTGCRWSSGPFDALGEALGCRGRVVHRHAARWLRAAARCGASASWCATTSSASRQCDDGVRRAGRRGRRLRRCAGRQPGVTLCYRRERAPGWPYNLYCMVHGRDRAAVRRARGGHRQRGLPHTARVLFSRRRFKQTGARRFRDAWLSAAEVAPMPPDADLPRAARA